MKTVHVAAGKTYDVLIENGLLAKTGELLRRTLGAPCKAAIFTDDTVGQLYGERVEEALRTSGFETCRFVFVHGEEQKTLRTWTDMLDFLSQNHLTRADVIVALGGGVVGDMAGFAAASYLRGIRFMQIPTTLLAMVDSSVGGKTGVNLTAGKNLVGAFHQPCIVLCDPDTLKTLPEETFADGAAEVIKYGVLGDEELFERLAGGAWQQRIMDVIESCVSAKAALVEADEKDTASRQLLNLGHTIGHAIEKCSGYGVSHGRAVAIGLVYAARIARKLQLCAANVPDRIEKCLLANQLPISAPYAAEELHRAALSDKKRGGEQITFVLPHRIGRCELHSINVARLGQWIAYGKE